MNKLENYVTGRWITGDGDGQALYDAVTGETIAAATTKGLDFKGILQYGREVGNTNLRKYTFHERGRMLRALAMHLMAQKEKFYQISYHSGATRADSWIDIEGGIGNLFANASLRRKFPDLPYCTDGEPVGLSKGGTFMAHHLLVPKEGVAVGYVGKMCRKLAGRRTGGCEAGVHYILFDRSGGKRDHCFRHSA
jgi:oxepin-CoA hydrolase/3-oxo-5,6-dehydrosuberyl-CoA semialdehyde dehydrogenase